MKKIFFTTRENNLLSLKEFALLKKFIMPDIDETGELVIKSKTISVTDLTKGYSNNKTIATKRTLLKLKEKNLVCCDENDEVISVNDSGISQFLERKNQLKKSFVKNSIFLLALIIISIIPIFEIITHGLFLNSYSDNDETYKFYLSTYKVVEIDTGDIIEEGTYEIYDDSIKLIGTHRGEGDGPYDIERWLGRYKNNIFVSTGNESYHYDNLPCYKEDDTYYEGSRDMGFVGYSYLEITLNSDKTFVFHERQPFSCTVTKTGKYELKDNYITFNVEDVDSNYGYNPEKKKFKMYGIILEDILYPNVYRKN